MSGVNFLVRGKMKYDEFRKIGKSESKCRLW